MTSTILWFIFEKRRLFFWVIIAIAFIPVKAAGQGSEGVGINTTTIDPHAVLDIRNSGSGGTFKGVKMPFLPASSALQAMDGANPGIMFFDSESNQLYNSIVDDNGAQGWDPAGWGMRGTPNTDVNKHWIGTTDNIGFSIGTNNSLRIRIRPNGKVGIGLTNPSELLEVNGAIKIGTADNSNPGTIQWTGNDLELYKDTGWISLTNTSSGDDDWLIGNSIYNLTNNIGIGTGSPSNKLGVAGGVAIGSSFASTTTTATNGLNVEGNVGIGTAGSSTYQLHLKSTGGTHTRGFYNYQGGSPSGTGYGIYNNIHMNTSSAVYGIRNYVGSEGTSHKYGLYNYVYGNAASSGIVYGINQYVYHYGTGAAYGLRLQNNGSGSGTDYGIYSTGEDINYFQGDMGIGDISPDGKLEVRQTGTDDIFNLYDDATNIFSVIDGGNVGVGITAPSEKIQVAGNIYASNGDLYAAATNGVINCGGGIMSASLNYIGDNYSTPSNVSGDEDLYIEDDLQVGSVAYKPGGGSWTAASDKRLKKNIVPFNDGLSELMKVKPVQFNYNEKSGFNDLDKQYIGIIAQDLIEVAPYMVEESNFWQQVVEDENGVERIVKEGEKFYTVDPSAFTYMLINSIQEQQKMIEDQQKEINLLKQEMERINKK